jgi:hypothetical protein
MEEFLPLGLGVVSPPTPWCSFSQGGCIFCPGPWCGHIEAVSCWFIAFLQTLPTLGQNDFLLFQTAQCLQQGLFTQSHSSIKHTAICSLEAVEHLRQTDVVTLPLEAEGAADDVQHDLQP